MCSASQPSSRAIARGDAQREALLAEQRVAAVAGAVRPDLAGLGEVHDVLRRRCTATARPCAAGSSGAPTECRHGTKSPSSPSTSSARLAHARHDAHVDDDVGRVGDLDADVRDRRAERAHRERHDVHRAARASSREQAGRASRASRRGRTSCWSGRRRALRSEQMNVRSSTRATSLGSERARKQLGRLLPGQALEGAGRRRAARSGASHSSAEPSHQSTRSGWVTSATSSTHSMRRAWSVRARAAGPVWVLMAFGRSWNGFSESARTGTRPPARALRRGSRTAVVSHFGAKSSSGGDLALHLGHAHAAGGRRRRARLEQDPIERCPVIDPRSKITDPPLDHPARLITAHVGTAIDHAKSGLEWLEQSMLASAVVAPLVGGAVFAAVPYLRRPTGSQPGTRLPGRSHRASVFDRRSGGVSPAGTHDPG